MKSPKDVLCSELFSIFLSYLADGIKHTLKKSVDNINLVLVIGRIVASTSKDRIKLHNDLNKLEKWSEVNGNGKVLHSG